ncbi:MAG: extracellular solute-binding protein [Candidatus Dormibacteraeota bacterium]|nr:extracellular solute-binding protein [Candidatus Dormibacteraeota bacterium]
MTFLDRTITRREAIRAGLVGSAGLYLASCGVSTGGSSNAVTLNWITWNDHYLDDQLKAVNSTNHIGARVTLESDDSDGYVKIKQTKGQFDVVSTDALWAPKFHTDGLVDSFDMSSIPASSQLYSLARDVFPFWKDGSKSMAYPFGWSTIQLYYNPAHVSPAPDSWHVLADPKYKGKVVAENQPTDLMAMAGLATGAKQPYGMTTTEIAAAKHFLQTVKPQFQKLVSQNSDSVKALADGSAWIALENLGTDFRVKDAGGPAVKFATPSEGTYGFIDGEMIVSASANKAQFSKFIDSMEQAEWIAKNFIANGRPLFNEKAYKLLVNQGMQERADLLLYNKPEEALKMTLKGPSSNEQAYIDAFNEVFGA